MLLVQSQTRELKESRRKRKERKVNLSAFLHFDSTTTTTTSTTTTTTAKKEIAEYSGILVVEGFVKTAAETAETTE